MTSKRKKKPKKKKKPRKAHIKMEQEFEMWKYDQEFDKNKENRTPQSEFIRFLKDRENNDPFILKNGKELWPKFANTQQCKDIFEEERKEAEELAFSKQTKSKHYLR